MSASFSSQTYLPGCHWCRSHPKSLRDEWRRGRMLASLSVPEQMSPVLTLSWSRWVLGERSLSYGRLNGLIVKFSHGAPGYDRRQNYTIIKGHWICIGIHYFVKMLGHTCILLATLLEMFEVCTPKSLQLMLSNSLKTGKQTMNGKPDKSHWIHWKILFVLCLYFK